MNVALYLRVSTAEQTSDNQRRELLEAGRRLNWNVVHVFNDTASGAAGKTRRGYKQLCQVVARRQVDLVAAWSVDRLGRSLQELVGFMGELQAKGIGLYLHQQGIDTTTPAGRALFGMLGVFAEFERAIMRDRIFAGIARARAQGKAIGRPRTALATEQLIGHLLDQRQPVRVVARLASVGISTVQRVQRERLAKQESGLAFPARS
jgi:DNA invertase Pin-like site-specific DNA recombinase